MKAMEILQQYWEQAKRLLVYIQFCIDNDIRTPVCRDFWTWTVYLCVGLALLIIFVVGRKILRAQLELRRNKKRLEARKIVADADTGKVLGVHALAETAGEMMLAATYAIKAGFTVTQLADTWAPYLTMAEGIRLTANLFRNELPTSCCA